MTKKSDKRLCWNCEGDVSLNIHQCPYCGVDLNKPPLQKDLSVFPGFSSPFQSAPSATEAPPPPYVQSPPFSLKPTKEEWDSSLQPTKENPSSTEESPSTLGREICILLLLLPGAVFFLFSLTLFFFSSDGVLTLSWHQNISYFYFFGSIPLLYLGWKSLRPSS